MNPISRFIAGAAYQGPALGALVVVVLCLISGELRAQACNPFTFDKLCPTADTLTFCPISGPNANTVQTVSCESGFVQRNGQPFFVSNARCSTYACSGSCSALETDEICVAAQSGTCLGMAFDVVGSELARQLVCGAGQSCVTRGPFDDICVGNVFGTCAVGEQTKGCLGGIATFCFDLPTSTSAFADPLGIDCSTFNGTCVEGLGQPSCEVPVGESCAPPFIRCAAGLTCVGHSTVDETYGTCADVGDAGPPPVNDAGTPPVNDAGTPPVNDAGAPPVNDDAGDPLPPPTGDCGALTELGECDGSTLRWCQAGVVEARDCADEDLVCAEVGPATGFNCVEPPVELPDCACAAAPTRLPGAALALLALGALLRRRRR